MTVEPQKSADVICERHCRFSGGSQQVHINTVGSRAVGIFMIIRSRIYGRWVKQLTGVVHFYSLAKEFWPLLHLIATEGLFLLLSRIRQRCADSTFDGRLAATPNSLFPPSTWVLSPGPIVADLSDALRRALKTDRRISYAGVPLRTTGRPDTGVMS